MIKSKLSIWGIMFIVMNLFYCFVLVYFIYESISAYLTNVVPGNTETIYAFRIQLILIVILCAAFIVMGLNSLIRYSSIATIDKNAKTIIFRNLITQRKKNYKFSDFDGYLDTEASKPHNRSIEYKVIYFIKNEKAKEIISGYYNSNCTDLKIALSSMKYLGFEKNFSKLARRSFFHKTLV
ncbi:MAG TPA: hypothetical protein VK718_01085 [Ferruginibacter sp.]|jgi:hypothetical protein|nr:hypothetical protein [Ferruginibacter sp.]